MPTQQSPAPPPEYLAPWTPEQSDAPTDMAPGPEAPSVKGVVPPTNFPVPGTPAPAEPGVMYCSGCGNQINPRASVCVTCGVAPQVNSPARQANPKTKSTAVILAVLFGLFAWIYTYKRDTWKFWLNLGLTVVTVGLFGIISWVWAIIDMSVRDSAWYESFPNGR